MIDGSVNGYGETFWKTTIPDEYCSPGLEVGIVASRVGIRIGLDMIEWEAIDKARKLATEAD